MPETARDHLRAAMARQERDDIVGALAEERKALELEPGFADARSYLGSIRGSCTAGLRGTCDAVSTWVPTVR